MTRIASLLGASAALLIVALAHAQADSQDKPPGDVAREQREIQKQHSKNNRTRVFTNDDLQSGSDEQTRDSAAEQDTRADAEKTAADAKKQRADSKENSKDLTTDRRPQPVLDRDKDSAPDLQVIPKGAQIHVDFNTKKVVVPVRVGFATPIPAGSPVKLQIARTYLQAYPNPDPNIRVPLLDYADQVTLVGVTAGGRVYPVQCDVLPLMLGATNSEMVFTLQEPLSIPY